MSPVCHRTIACVVIVAFLSLGAVQCEPPEENVATEAENVAVQEDVPDFAKMRVKALRALLKERGVECKGCAEKANFVERVRYGAGRAPCVEAVADHMCEQGDVPPAKAGSRQPG